MQRLRRWPPACVEIKLLAFLIRIKEVIEVAMGEEDAAAEEDVGRATGEACDAVDEGLVEALAAKLVDELVVIDFAALLSRNFPRRHDLVLLLVIVVLHCGRERRRRERISYQLALGFFSGIRVFPEFLNEVF